jgi:uncharacterized protein (DUF1501 family)
MKRRDFAKFAALTSLAVTIPISTRRVHAAVDPYGGPYYVLINAGGGWDPRCMFDPSLDPEQNRLYTDIGTIGNINYAPIPLPPTDPLAEYDPNTILLSNEEFLNLHGNRLLVMNGVDMETNNHDAGSRAIWSGKLQEGYPSIGALVAAQHAPEQPMTYLSSGGYDSTEGLVPLTRVGSADTLRKIAYPNRIDPGNVENLDTYHAESTWALIKQMQAERLQALHDSATLPRERSSMAHLQLARANDDDLKRLELPEDLVSLDGYDLRTVEQSMQQAQVAVNAFKSGIASAVNLNIGGFDTHGNHDTDQPEQIAYLLTLIDFVTKEVEVAGLTDKVVILVGSDFARGPYYNGPNDNDGKDHWPIGSFLAMGPGIEGNRVIGGTTPDQLPLGVDESSLATQDTGGTVITAQHIHHALREMAGIDSAADSYPLSGGTLPLFG